MTTYLAPQLIDQGYIGATGTTPYRLATASQFSQLQSNYNFSFAGRVLRTVSSSATVTNAYGAHGGQDKRLDMEVGMRVGKTANKVSAMIFSLSALFLGACSVAQEPINPSTTEVITMETKKEQVLGFLRRLKKALDLNVIGDPQCLQEVTGFEVLAWDYFVNSPEKLAMKWRYNVPALDQAPEMFSVEGEYRTGYSPAYSPAHGIPYRGGIGISGFPSVACISPADVDQIFGIARLDYKLKAKPTDDGPWVAPFWETRSYLLNPSTESILTLNYNYEDEKKPRATCLKGLSIGYGGKPPIGY